MPVGQGKQVSKEGAYLAMWLTSDTKFNEVIRSICLKTDDMQFWLYNYNQKIYLQKYIISIQIRAEQGKWMSEEGAY